MAEDALFALVRALSAGARVRDGVDVLSVDGPRFFVARRGGAATAIDHEEARERLAWLIENELEAVVGLVTPYGVDTARAREDLAANHPEVVSRLRMTLDPANVVFDAFVCGYRWETGNRECFYQAHFDGTHVL